MSELVTGEAVTLELRPAKLPTRAVGVLIDQVVAWLIFIVVSVVLFASTGSLDDAAVAALSVALFVLVLVGVPIAVETLSRGRSLGKLVCGLRVVRDDGGPIRFRHALVRGAVGVVEIIGTAGVVACLASLASENGRRVGDVFAGTLVVRERVPSGSAPLVPPPPAWLAGRFSALDLSGVPEGLWLAVRQYLTRMRNLDPQIGGAMAEGLASDLAAATGVPVPPGVPSSAYLAAVVQERQTRDARRAFGGGPGGAGAGASPAPTPVAAPASPVFLGEGITEGGGRGGSAAVPATEVPGPGPSPPAAPVRQRPEGTEPPPRPATGFVPPA
ncbi:RDD family protein [Streptomyces tsukubensis]|uniref:RDD domain-containing protein n=1 Tax=Streptomyces tsukubensis TaxID=83656 RepID=A0A1V3ZZH1_9ACTN|nr:RDD family protein [Streptomyces tsukubensis]OON71310.1 hypothetical protein B1H18_34420 [Streptomyces tsukubensis]QFR93938.1 RDD family protein [Streptomyces tsukubensis]